MYNLKDIIIRYTVACSGWKKINTQLFESWTAFSRDEDELFTTFFDFVLTYGMQASSDWFR